MEKEKIKQIDYRFIFLYVVGSTLIIAGHCYGGGVNLFYNYIPAGAYHLALWTFCSGYFYNCKKEEKIIPYIWGKFKKLIIPLFIWNLIYGILVYFLHKFDVISYGKELSFKTLFIFPINNGHQFIFNMCTWYVIPLFVCQVFNVLFRKIIKCKNEYVIFIIYVLLGFTGLYLANKGYNSDWWLFLTRFLYFIPFYGLGYFYKIKLEKHDKVNNFIYFSIIFLIIIILKTFVSENIAITSSWMKNIPSKFWIPLLSGTLGIALWLRIAKIVEPLIKNSKIINLIAENAYNIMLHQFIGFFIVKLFAGFANCYLNVCNAFNWARFKKDVWYYYLPREREEWYIVYIIAGLFIPIFIGKISKKIMKIININKLKNISNRLINNIRG